MLWKALVSFGQWLNILATVVLGLPGVLFTISGSCELQSTNYLSGLILNRKIRKDQFERVKNDQLDYEP